MNQQQIDEIKKHHKPSIAGLKDIIKTRNPLCQAPFIISTILSIFFLVVFIFNPEKSFVGIDKLAEIITICFPCLLGFSLAGYAMVVGFPNTELIQEDSQTNDYTLYQVLSAFFALSIILQVFATAIAFCIWWFIKIDVTGLLNFNCEHIGYFVNIAFIFILLFIGLYAVCLTPYIAINLFSLSQVNSTFFTVKKINKEEEEAK